MFVPCISNRHWRDRGFYRPKLLGWAASPAGGEFYSAHSNKFATAFCGSHRVRFISSAFFGEARRLVVRN